MRHLQVPTAEHVAQIDVVGQRLGQGAELGNTYLAAFDDDGDARAVAGNAEALTVALGHRAILATVIVEIAAVLGAEQFDPRQPAIMDGFQPAVAKAEDRLLETAAKIAAPATGALRQRAVCAAIAENGAGGGERHALGVIGDRQQGAAPVTLVLHEDLPGNCHARRFQSGVAVLAVGDQFDQRLFDRGEAPGVDVDDTLIHRDCVDRHRCCLARVRPRTPSGGTTCGALCN